MLSREELRGVYSKLFTRPDDPSGNQRRTELCTALRKPSLAAAQTTVGSLLSQYHGGSTNLSLDDTQWKCIQDAFTSPMFALLQAVKDGKPKAPDANGVLDVGPCELAFIYYSLFGQKDEKAHKPTHDLLHKMKHAAYLINDENKRRAAIKGFLKDAYNRMLSNSETKVTELRINHGIIDQMVVMLTTAGYKSLEPYEGEPCLLGSKSIACY